MWLKLRCYEGSQFIQQNSKIFHDSNQHRRCLTQLSPSFFSLSMQPGSVFWDGGASTARSPCKVSTEVVGVGLCRVWGRVAPRKIGTAFELEILGKQECFTCHSLLEKTPVSQVTLRINSVLSWCVFFYCKAKQQGFRYLLSFTEEPKLSSNVLLKL